MCPFCNQPYSRANEELFGVSVPDDALPRYNVAPTQEVLAVTASDHQRQARFFRWGLVPSWAGDPSIGRRLINARAETVAEKPAFRNAFKSRRCVIPASGFIEWSHKQRERESASGSVPGGQMAFAESNEGGAKATLPADSRGLARVRHRRSLGAMGEPTGSLDTCTILTTETNELVTQLHDRMPCILDEDSVDAWLSDEEPSRLTPLLAPYPSDRMRSIPLDPRINDARLEGADLLRPI